MLKLVLVGLGCEGKIRCVVVPVTQITVSGLADTQVLAVKCTFKPILFEIWVKLSL